MRCFICWGVFHVLLVEEYKNRCASKLRITAHFGKLLLYFNHAILVGAIYNKDYCINLIKVMFPETSCLSAYVPKCKAVTSVGNLFNIKANRRHCVFK